MVERPLGPTVAENSPRVNPRPKAEDREYSVHSKQYAEPRMRGGVCVLSTVYGVLSNAYATAFK